MCDWNMCGKNETSHTTLNGHRNVGYVVVAFNMEFHIVFIEQRWTAVVPRQIDEKTTVVLLLLSSRLDGHILNNVIREGTIFAISVR
jgi:hypothetical protein